MRVLFIYRHPDMGFSIGKVFHPIEEAMRKYCEVDALYLPIPNYKPIGLWKNIRCGIRTAKLKQYDIIHITGSEHYLLPFLKKQRTVVTVHDLGFFTNQHLNFRSIWKYFLWIKTLKYADRVTFISEKSQLEAKRYVRFQQGQDCIIHNPLGREFKYKEKKFNSSHPTVLHIGTKPNKNLKNTLIALKDFPYKLRIIGKLSKAQKNILKIYQTDYTNTYNLTDEEIVEEYEKCDIVNFPSFYEGFGMPIIEGQAIGRVIVTSDLSPMKEVANGTAILVNPNNVTSILNGYKEAIQHYQTYIKAGLENISRFQLDAITKKYYKLYLELSQSKSYSKKII